jgi:hypothetical protein
MDKKTYLIKLDDLSDKIKSLKSEINNSKDEEKIKYLTMALKSTNKEMQSLMDTNYKKI